jgi:hypothetical protein
MDKELRPARLLLAVLFGRFSMRSPLLVILVALLTFHSGQAAVGHESMNASNQGPQEVSVRPVREMNRIPEVDDWTSCAAGAFSAETVDAARTWAKICPSVQKELTPELVRSLSRWAMPQMASYTKVPAINKVVWTAVSRDNDTRRLVLETTVDKLPTHSPLVKRWLKLFLVYEPSTRSIPTVIVTIRGELLE